MSIEAEAAPQPASPTPTATVVSTPSPAASPTAPAAEPKIEVVSMSLADYNALMAQKAENERRAAEEAAKAREANERALQRQIEAGKVTEALEAIKQTRDQDVVRAREEEARKAAAEREKVAAELRRTSDEKARVENERQSIEQRAKKFALDGELGRALASHNLVEGAAEDLTALLRGQLTVEPDGDSFAVRATGGQTVQDFVKQYLDRRPHYVRSSTGRGGTIGGGSTAGTSPNPTPTPAMPEARNLGEWAVVAGKTAAASAFANDPVMAVMSQPMGLRPVR